MKFTRIAIPVALVLALASCNQGPNKHQARGTVIGAGLGALAGSQIGGGRGKLAAVAIGTLAGAVFGNRIGRQLDRDDRQAMQTTSQTALERNPVGRPSSWNNPDSGHRGTVTPTRTYQTAAGQPCREYQQTVTIDGRTEKAYGQACRQADGSWRIVK